MPVDDANTKSLIHFNGSDGATAITDESGKSWTVHGNAQIDTAQSKFGGASALLDGTGDYWDTPNHADFDLTQSYWTMETWVRLNAYPANDSKFVLMAQATGVSDYFLFEIYNLSSTRYIVFEFANGVNDPQYNTVTANLNTWYHTATVRNNGALLIYWNGSRVVNISSYDFAGMAQTYTGTFKVGANWDGGYSVNGWMDEFRFSTVARWTGSTYTVPTAEYAASAGGILLPNRTRLDQDLLVR